MAINPAYVAGFIDADGCISCGTTKKGEIRLTVIVVQKEPNIPTLLHKQYGGYLGIAKRGKFVYHRWTISGKNALKILHDIEPYIIEKAKQVELGLFIINHIIEVNLHRYKRGVQGTQLVRTDKEKALRTSLWLKMKSLNTCHKASAAAETKSTDNEAVEAIVRPLE